MKNKLGFSLLELIVAISIIGTLFAITLFSQNSDSTQKLANQDASVIKSNILKMYDNTIFGLVYQTYGHDNGFGVYFDLNSPKNYILFCDKNEDLEYSGVDEKIEDALLRNASLKGLSNPSNGTMTILFKNKDGKTFLNKVLAGIADIEVTITNKGSDQKIKLNPITYKIDVE